MARRAFTQTDAANALRNQSTVRGEYSPDRRPWTPNSMLKTCEVVIYQGPQGAPAPGYEDIEDVWVSITGSRKRAPVKIYLCRLRLDELEVLKEVLDEAIDRARPLIEEQAKRDTARFAAGGEPPISAYRDTPHVIRRDELTPEAERALLFHGRDAALPAASDDDAD